MGMGLFMAVGRGSDNPPRMIVMRSGKAGEKDALGRHLAIVGKGVCFDSGGISHQAIRPDGRDEDGQDRRMHGHRGDGHGRPPRPGHAAARDRAGGREHARPPLDPARRRRQGAQRQVGRHHQHGRRGPPHPRRRPDLRGAARRDPPRRCRDPDGAVSRALGELVAGAFGTPQPLVDEVFAAGEGAASATGSCPSSRNTGPTWRAGTATS